MAAPVRRMKLRVDGVVMPGDVVGFEYEIPAIEITSWDSAGPINYLPNYGAETFTVTRRLFGLDVQHANHKTNHLHWPLRVQELTGFACVEVEEEWFDRAEVFDVDRDVVLGRICRDSRRLDAWLAANVSNSKAPCSVCGRPTCWLANPLQHVPMFVERFPYFDEDFDDG